MKTRAKFICTGIQRHDGGDINVSMSVVTDGSEENKAFNDATPGGHLNLHIAAGKEAQNNFEEGKTYFVDFTPAD